MKPRLLADGCGRCGAQQALAGLHDQREHAFGKRGADRRQLAQRPARQGQVEEPAVVSELARVGCVSSPAPAKVAAKCPAVDGRISCRQTRSGSWRASAAAWSARSFVRPATFQLISFRRLRSKTHLGAQSDRALARQPEVVGGLGRDHRRRQEQVLAPPAHPRTVAGPELHPATDRTTCRSRRRRLRPDLLDLPDQAGTSKCSA